MKIDAKSWISAPSVNRFTGEFMECDNWLPLLEACKFSSFSTRNRYFFIFTDIKSLSEAQAHTSLVSFNGRPYYKTPPPSDASLVHLLIVANVA